MQRAVVSVFSSKYEESLKEKKEEKKDRKKPKIYKKFDSVGSIPLPDVFRAPIRVDIVNRMHHWLRLNMRQPQGRFIHAGEQHSAESWGTGRAVARIPRISGKGTHSAGQGAFGNMCRGGRMFSPLKTWRVWWHKISISQKRYAKVSAIAASSLAPLVMARGHKIERLQEIPFVVTDEIESYKKTKQAVALLRKYNCIPDVFRVIQARKRRSSQAKRKTHKYVEKKGPLIIYSKDNGVSKAFANIPGCETMCVSKLNLIHLAPGGKVGRFIIWSESAFKELEVLFGSYDGKTSQAKLKTRQGNMFRLPRPMMQNTDVAKIIQSEAIQSVVLPPKPHQKPKGKYHNPLKDYKAMLRLNPAVQITKRKELFEKVFKEKFGETKEMKEKREKMEKRIKNATKKMEEKFKKMDEEIKIEKKN